ncbi:hypothetical protein [Pseudoalteromonas luteoviolacea]|uniref:Lipoprotein n=1 Tax=Pseudoalteromonas luteoviolacea DSM 6061 TaxID=1365250 RepID=A0A166VJ13_9GAMM|nr:hypothetical protein [Pseudoalteromonas luteoviolacea]KZN32927.1 hypothetical protein N475_20625 [Pseudoalteromonas luteoviolacea DSM 6061]KZN55730.1 hypothetical protein N474_14375 [Pseudoalteromonas luteoviolacea CPMOR-2]MBE0385355.1 hypothetical protein [Pseudoalteromonas luteoviolacea DSM 6061]TQF69974.1 hypothetical protein FLM44_02450 [Pseudoalteromonas luteoviolacea]
MIKITKTQLLMCTLSTMLLGCTHTTTVHVFGKYLPDNELSKLQSALNEQGFEVETNSLDFPTSISQNTILHSLMLRDSSALESVKSIAMEHGFKIADIQGLKEGNHWYTKDAIAIYPFPKNSENAPLLKQDLAQQFSTAECDLSFQLKLSRNGAYEILGSPVSEDNKRLLTGTWHYVQYPYLELRPYKGISWSRYFEIHQLIKQDKVSQIEVIQLRPVEKHHITQNCFYEYGVRM